MELLKIQELLYQAFDYFNKELCNDSLPKPVITVLSRGTKKRALGWMWRNKWQVGADIQHEISISAETLDRPFEDLCHTLLHEMAHLYNAHANINDCNPAGRHNRKFKKTATDIFKLEVHNDPKLGWAYTNLTDESQALVDQFKLQATITEWALKRLDPQKPVVEKVYTVQLTQDDKEWLKERAEEDGIKPRELLAKIIEEYRSKPEDEISEE
jgi:hypothetical protein